MQALATRLGFAITSCPDDEEMVRATLPLQPLARDSSYEDASYRPSWDVPCAELADASASADAY